MNSSVGISSPDVGQLTAAATAMVKNTALEVSALWWAWLLRAIVWGVIGIIFLFYQDVGVKTLALLIGIWFIADGASSIIGGLFTDGLSLGRRLFLLIIGVLAIVAGVAVLAWPDLTIVTVAIVAAIYALMFGALLLFSAIFDESHIMPRWLQFLLGIAAIGFGLYFIFEPETKTDDLLTVFGIFALVGAVLYLLAALQLRGLHHELKASTSK